jgi:hypothetical protein
VCHVDGAVPPSNGAWLNDGELLMARYAVLVRRYPGIARAQQLAAHALRDTARRHLAEAAFTACVTDPAQIRRLTDRSRCRGTAGS